MSRATQIDVLVDSVASGLSLSGNFYTGPRIIVRINGTSFAFSVAAPVLLAVSTSEGINILRNTPSILSTLQENVRAIRAVLVRIEALTILSPIFYFHLRSVDIVRLRDVGKSRDFCAAQCAFV